MAEVRYTEENIITLEWREHIRMRPGMYIGKLGDGSAPDDGIYVLLKEVIDNSIDEYVMGYGKQIEISEEDGYVTVRDYGRGIPLGKVVDCVSRINTGGKYDSKAFKKSVGLNGVGTKAVNALSDYFKVEAFRDGKSKAAEFAKGEITAESKIVKSSDTNGTLVVFHPDPEIFRKFKFRPEFMEMLQDAQVKTLDIYPVHKADTIHKMGQMVYVFVHRGLVHAVPILLAFDLDIVPDLHAFFTSHRLAMFQGHFKTGLESSQGYLLREVRVSHASTITGHYLFITEPEKIESVLEFF